MKLNNKGFAITSIIYGIMILFSLIMVALLGMLVSRNTRSEKLAKKTSEYTYGESYNYTINQTITDSSSYKTPYTGKYTFTINNTKCYIYLKKNEELSISDIKEKNKKYHCDKVAPTEFTSMVINSINSNEQNNIDKSRANYPDLLDGLIPIYYKYNVDNNGESWKIADRGNTDISNPWYNYKDKIWANAATINNKDKATNLGNNNYNGIYSETLEYNSSNNYLTFDKTSDYIETNNKIEIPDNETYILKFSILEDNPISKRIIGSTVAGTLIYFNSKGDLVYAHENNRYKINSVLNKNQVHILVISYDKNKEKEERLTVKLDGTTVTFTLLSFSDISSNPQNILYISSNVQDMSINMKLYDAYYLNRVISDEEINKYYDNGYLPTNKDVIIHYNFSSSLPAGMPINIAAFDTMYVWVPRFKYKVMNIEKNSEASEWPGDIIFEKNKESTGTIKCFSEEDEEICTGNNGEYYTHPAFKNSKNEDITGFWMGKFKVVEEDSVVKIKDCSSCTNIFNKDKIQQMTKEDNIYGFNSTTTESTMITSLKWGAMEYLANKITPEGMAERSEFDITKGWNGIYDICTNNLVDEAIKYDNLGEGTTEFGGFTSMYFLPNSNEKFIRGNSDSGVIFYDGVDSPTNVVTHAVLNSIE